MAQTCVGGSGSYYGFTTSSNPTEATCAFEDYLSVGPGTSFLAQDQSSTTSNTYALQATTLHNTAVYAYAEAGNGVFGLSGTTSVPSGTNYGVYGVSATSDGVHGAASTSGMSGVAGIHSGAGNGVYGRSTSSFGIVGLSGGTSTPQNVSGPGIAGVAGAGTGFEIYGLFGTSTNADGIHGYITSNWAAVAGDNEYAGTSGFANGVWGHSSSATGRGVYGEDSAGGYGVYGAATNNSAGIGVYGTDSGVNGSYGTGILAYSGNDRGTALSANCTGAQCTAASFTGMTSVTGAFYVNGVCEFGCSSDERLKQNIEPLTGALDKILQLKGATYEWKDPAEHQNHTGTQIGVIAQQVEKVFPQWVREDNKGFKTVDPDPRTMTALTVEGFRTLKAENDALKERVKALETGTHPIMGSTGLGGNSGWAFGGLALVSSLILSRKKREDKKS
jgi:hypothetical protein